MENRKNTINNSKNKTQQHEQTTTTKPYNKQSQQPINHNNKIEHYQHKIRVMKGGKQKGIKLNLINLLSLNDIKQILYSIANLFSIMISC